MKAFGEPRAALAARAGLILLFDGEVGRRGHGLNPVQCSHDEHSLADILTSGLTSLPAFPVKPVAMGQMPACEHAWLAVWKLVARYSGATVPDSHGVPGRRAVMRFQRTSLL